MTIKNNDGDKNGEKVYFGLSVNDHTQNLLV